MPKSHPDNERLKYDYLQYLRDADGKSEAAVDAAARAISMFEEATDYRDFRRFHSEQAIAFKRNLLKTRNARTGAPISPSTVHGALGALKKFFIWVADRPGYKSKISYTDAAYFNLPDKEVRIAKASSEKPTPTLEQIEAALAAMPVTNDVEKRNRALVAFAILTGARDGALASFRIGDIDLARGMVRQDARTVKTKFSKSFDTWFFPVGDKPKLIVEDWIAHLRGNLMRAESDALFPSTKVARQITGGFSAVGLNRNGWSNAGPIRRVFKDAFFAANLPYFTPHSFRHTLARLGEKLCRTPEEFKAWSQNLGHDGVMTTFTSYGAVPNHRQGEIIGNLSAPGTSSDEREKEAFAAAFETYNKIKAANL